MKFFLSSKKFSDSLDKAVFTTVYVMKENSPITLISHELDGDWQFMGAEPIDDYTKIAMVVGLGEIIKIDKTVLKVADLPKGYRATRLNKKSEWEICKIEYSEEEIKQMGFKCSVCGEYHKEIPMAYGADAPFRYSEIPENELGKRCVMDEDVCVIDSRDFYIKGNLLIPVEGMEEFSWNVWVQISEKDFNGMNELWTDENRILEKPYDGKIATDLEVYPSVLNLSVKVHTQKVGFRPKIEVVPISHPLYFEQDNGITIKRVISFAEKILYSH